ncbi:hypothetical protein AB0B12_14550 [Streptomyces sp. NPDC044780]|uniref:hypothetical protein n=1 Tax=unclassified Streptomyces TaxID=2593676 RepID=UPI0033CF1E3A
MRLPPVRLMPDHGTPDHISGVTGAAGALSTSLVSLTARNRRWPAAVAAGLATTLALGGLATVSGHGAGPADSAHPTATTTPGPEQ